MALTKDEMVKRFKEQQMKEKESSRKISSSPLVQMASYFDEEKALVDNTLKPSGANLRHHVVVDKDISSRQDLQLGETATVKKSVGSYSQQIKLDDGIYELDYQRSDMPKAFSSGNVVNNITTENHSIEFDGNTDTIRFIDDASNLRVILGRIGSSSNFGLKVNNASATELFGLYGSTANIAGWTVDTDHLLSSDGFTNINSAGHITLGNTSTTDVLKLSGVADDDYRIWVGNITDILAPFRVHKDGSFYSVQGTIGGWSIGETILKSDTGYGARIQLDRGENRVSIFDGSNTEKVAMGYLDELLKSNGTKVGSTTYTTTTMTDAGRTEAAENAWEVNELVDLYIEPVGKTRVQIISNTFQEITVAAWVDGGTPSEDDDFRIEFGSQDYGFWVLPGDRLHIDGDVQYEGGDWLIQHDASLKIVNSAGLEVIRLGTDTGEKGLFLYDGSAGGGYPAASNTLAKFHTTGIQLGPTATEYMSIAVGSITMYDGGDARSEWKDGYLSLGGAIDETSDCMILKAGEGIKIYGNDGSNQAIAEFGTTTYIGLQASEHMKLTASSMEFKDGSTTMMSLSTAGGGTITMGGKIILNSNSVDNVCIGIDNPDVGQRNVRIGIEAGKDAGSSSEDNVCIGHKALKINVSGDDCIAIGNYAAEEFKSSQCVAIGHQALRYKERGDHNNGIGYQAMAMASSGVHEGSYNNAFGSGCMQYAVSNGSNIFRYNLALGHQALRLINNTSGHVESNIALGFDAGRTMTHGLFNTFIGYQTQPSAIAGSSFQIVIGSLISGTADNTFTFGKTGNKATSTVFTSSGSCTFTFSSDERKKRNIKDETLGLEFINKLRPRTFQWKPNNELPKEWEAYSEENTTDIEKVYHGFIAQEVKSVLDEYGVADELDVWSQDGDGMQRLSETKLVTQLIKAVQELSEKVKILENNNG